jgi:hypothetical protein
MKIEDIRVGNWVYHNYNWSSRNEGANPEGYYFQIDESDFYADAECRLSIEDDLEGILIDETWLLRFGFRPTDCALYSYGLYFTWNSFTNSLFLWKTEVTHIKYVHQLQNLYYALTSSELIYNQQ